MILFNYSLFAVIEGRWNFFERISRGLILNKKTGEVVARPYDKFFNWHENYVPKPNRRTREIVSLTEKMDGSMLILYRHPEGGYRLATRGSFTSDQAIAGTKLLHEKYSLDAELPYECTLLFEYIAPDNRIVVDYGDRHSLVLIGARDRYTGEHYDLAFREDVANYYGFELPRSFDELIPAGNRSVDHIIGHIADWEWFQEGLVAEFNNGSFWKFKSPAYCRVHKILSTISFKNVLESVKQGTIDDTLELIPDHYKQEVQAMVTDIKDTIRNKITEVDEWFHKSPKHEVERKDYALWVKEHCPDVKVYMFAKLDGRDLTPLIFKHEFRNRSGKHLIGDE